MPVVKCTLADCAQLAAQCAGIDDINPFCISKSKEDKGIGNLGCL